MPIVLLFGPIYIDAFQGAFLTSRSPYGVGVFLTACMIVAGCTVHALSLYLTGRRATVALALLSGLGFAVIMLIVTFGLALFLPPVLIDLSVSRTAIINNVLRLIILVVALVAGAISSVVSLPRK